MSKLIRKPETQANNHEERLKEYFGQHLNGLRVMEDGGEIQVEIIYCDFKHIDNVRRELAQMMPEVEFTKLRRDFTYSAIRYALGCMVTADEECFEEPEIYVKQRDGSITPTSLREIASTALRQVELDENDNIPYYEDDLRTPNDEQLRSNAQD